jgi:MFS family permease
VRRRARPLLVVRRVAAPPEALRRAALAGPIPTGFADPVAPRSDGDAVRWSSVSDVVDEVERVARFLPDAGGTWVEVEARYELRMPYFGWLYAPLVRASVRRTLERLAATLEARARGAPEPPPPRRPVWAAPEPIPAARAASVAAISAALLVVGYAGSLFTQALDFLAASYGASDADLGVALALTRVGTLFALLGAALADRRGRRRVLLAAVAGASAAAGASALAPNLAAFTACQVVVRGCVQVAGVVGFVAVTEEAPESSRAFLLALAGMASGAGFAVGAALLPVADLAPGAWRALFAVAGLGLLALPDLARRLSETERYRALGARAAAARSSELLDPTYGGRFALVAAVVFLLALFGTPSLQFTNRYLQEVRGFSAADVLLLRAVTQGLPALVAIVVGGRLAETAGRRPVAARGALVLAVATAAFFLGDGALLWLGMLVGTVAGAASGPALTAFNTELFPTEVRGRAGGALLVVGVAGSVAGLLLVGSLAAPLGHVGRAVAVTTAAPILVALALVPRLPEGRGRALDELSPPEV